MSYVLARCGLIAAGATYPILSYPSYDEDRMTHTNGSVNGQDGNAASCGHKWERDLDPVGMTTSSAGQSLFVPILAVLWAGCV